MIPDVSQGSFNIQLLPIFFFNCHFFDSCIIVVFKLFFLSSGWPTQLPVAQKILLPIIVFCSSVPAAPLKLLPSDQTLKHPILVLHLSWLSFDSHHCMYAYEFVEEVGSLYWLIANLSIKFFYTNMIIKVSLLTEHLGIFKKAVQFLWTVFQKVLQQLQARGYINRMLQYCITFKWLACNER